MHYHMMLVDYCNSACRYCYEKSMREEKVDRFTFDFSAPSTSEVSVDALKQFLMRDKHAVLIFYGGEPLLEIEKMKKIMDTIDVPFRMQTNGKLLQRLPPPYLNRIGRILISLDGTRERTDFNRGRGTYDTVMRNLSLMRRNGYTGEIVARMTVAQNFPDIDAQVLSLVESGFSSVHWQLDAGFYWYDFQKEKFQRFVNHYNQGVTRLINYWIEKMKEGNVLRFYPFVGVVSSLLKGEKTLLRCGAGHSGYCITTNGKIVACPIMNFVEDFVAGTLETHPEKLKTLDVSGRCLECTIRDTCGGRCFYWNKAHPWPKEGDDLICKTVHHLIGELEDRIPVIEDLIEKDIVEKEDFEYEKYFGPEIIP